jgi:hypothetical protein
VVLKVRGLFGSWSRDLGFNDLQTPNEKVHQRNHLTFAVILKMEGWTLRTFDMYVCTKVKLALWMDSLPAKVQFKRNEYRHHCHF